MFLVFHYLLLFPHNFITIVVVQLLSLAWLFASPWTAAHRSPCSSLCSEVCPSAYPLIQWSHPSISCCCPFSSCQAFSATGSFPMGQFFTSGGQSIDVVNLLKYLKIFHLKMFSPTKQWLNSLYYHLSSISLYLLFNKTGFQFNI